MYLELYGSLQGNKCEVSPRKVTHEKKEKQT